ncbi:hypothetical protein ILUMI_07575 [Ignelater luminosus]|uniref:Phosphoglycolate phosphatase n=1 Tax=Ignelater luminosus TaxID=2038154 RepID=A0A8K0D3M5_IGNLU|nr:hypothetical protein ILUMI_07575 [Ignelater luminosus]
MKNEFKEAGFNLAELPDYFGEGRGAIKRLMEGSENIGAIILDVDINLNFAKMYKAALCLKRSDVLFLAGATDEKLLLGPNTFLIGPRYYLKIIEDFTGREPLVFGKPSFHLGKYISKKFNIIDASRTLFVGDSLETDMKFASLCGYQKMFVSTGVTKLDDMLRCKDKQMIPDYYLNSLGDLSQLIKDKLNI